MAAVEVLKGVGINSAMRYAGFSERRGSIGSTAMPFRQARAAGVLAMTGNVTRAQARAILMNSSRAEHGIPVRPIAEADRTDVSDYSASFVEKPEGQMNVSLRKLDIKDVGGTAVAVMTEVGEIPTTPDIGTLELPAEAELVSAGTREI